jgi:2-polyprenyl-3-methyl-5-hydroxy-6-metoxy-1,4-benzoquinol methylase
MKLFDYNKVQFENVDCPFCKANTEKEVLFKVPDRSGKSPGLFILVRCKNCGLAFQDPRPKEKFIQYYYPEFWYQNKEFLVPFWQQKIKKHILINYYGYTNLGQKNIFLKIILSPFYSYLYRYRSIPKYKENGKVLEIGCATGILLKELENLGWKVYGIEVNKKAAQIAKRKRRLNVRCGSIFDFDFKEGSFDVIILEMVIAHLYNPLLAIEKIARWLKADGQLIFSTPYLDGLEYRIFKEHSWGLHLPVHIFYFNKKTLYFLLKDHFKSIRIVFHHYDRDVIASAQFKYRATKNFLYKIIGYSRVFRWLIRFFLYFLAIFGKTSRITVFAVKK